MTARVLRPAITFATVSAVLLAALAVYLTFTDNGAVEADFGGYDATHTQVLDSVVPGAARGAVTTLRIPIDDYNFSNNITLDPMGVGYTYSCNDVAAGIPYIDLDDDGVNDGGAEAVCLEPGDASGTQSSNVKLGIAGNTCNSSLIVVHDLFAVELPNDLDNPRASTNIAWPRPQGSSNRFLGWAIGTGNGNSEPPPAGGTPVNDADLNTRAEGDSLQFQNYPKYLLDLFDPDGSDNDNVDNDGDTVVDEAGEGAALPPVVPVAVYGGSTQVAGTWVPLYYAQFTNGQLPAGFAGTEPDPFTRIVTAPAASASGHPNQAVLNDPTAQLANPSSITDFCSDLIASNDSNPTVGGVTRATNPATAGTHFTLNYTSSQRDTDNDGIENALDTCPRIANLDDIRLTTGGDGDTLDASCDPAPAAANADEDGDAFPNAQDICTLVSNPAQTDAEVGDNYRRATFDGGGQGDSLGNDGAGCEGGNVTSPYAPVATLTAGITATQIQFNYTSAGDPITAGDYINVGAGAEIMRVSDVNTGANSVIVSRAACGTTETAHLAAVSIERVTAGAITLNGVSTPTCYNSAASTGHYLNRGNVIPICYSTGPVDADGDGYCGAGTVGAASVDAADSGACNTAPTTPTPSRLSTCNVRHSAWTTTASMALLNVFDTDRGGGDNTAAGDPGGIGVASAPVVVCPTGLTDFCPENAFDSDWLESYVGTNPAQACAQNSGLNNEVYDSWAYDFNDDQRANLSDITAMGGGFNRFVNQDAAAGTSGGYASAVTLSVALPAHIGFDGNPVGTIATNNARAGNQLVYTGADVFAVGDYISLQTGATTNFEILRVNSVNGATNTLGVFRGALGSTATPAWAGGDVIEIRRVTGPRTDINNDGTTSLSDVTAFGPFFNKQCRRVDGTFGAAQ